MKNPGYKRGSSYCKDYHALTRLTGVRYVFAFFCLLFPFFILADVRVGVEVFFEEGVPDLLKGKRIGLITNQSAVNHNLQTTFDVFQKHVQEFKLVALFTPEHGYYGDAYADEKVSSQMLDGIPLFSLHGDHRRPTHEMLCNIDLLIYDIQDIGSRSYTFLSTLFYCMEEAAAEGIALTVLDRPNPMGGTIVDGPLLEKQWRSFLGYVNIPYCHGMTVGELAQLFNHEYKVGCDLTVIPMRGWKRGMTFSQTQLPWVPTSPQIPECDTPFFYPTTGLIGHCSIANIGIGYTLPFKLVGAPWIEAESLAVSLNKQNLPGVYFQPYFFRPFFGKFKLKSCQGVRIMITDSTCYLPVTTQFTIMGALKYLYPKEFKETMQQLINSHAKRDVFNKLNGTEKILDILSNEPYVIWKLRELCVEGRNKFLPIRRKYLIPSYK